MRILEVVNSSTNLNTFRDLGGLDDLMERIKVTQTLIVIYLIDRQVEIGVISELPKVEEKKEELKIDLKPRGKAKAKPKTPTKGKGKGKEKEKDTKDQVDDYQPVDMELFSENNCNYPWLFRSSNVLLASRLLNAHRLLLKTLLRGLVPFVRSQGTRRLNSSEGQALPLLIKSILQDPKKFGSAVVSLGILFIRLFCTTNNLLGLSLTAIIIYSEPTCYPILQTAGLTDTVISFVTSNLMPTSEVISAVPSTLSALCLNTAGLALVTDSQVIPTFLSIFTSPKYPDTPPPFGYTHHIINRSLICSLHICPP